MKSAIKFLLAVSVTFIYACGNRSTPAQPLSAVGINRESSPVTAKKDSTEKTGKSETSEITCPKCGYKKVELLPTEVCQLTYTCGKCAAVLYPKKGDCCVFCTYGDHKCPSMQE
jgi:hypothetical protein